jgi:hypothetical protein
MSIEQQLKLVADGMITLRRDNLRTLARVKALEAMVREALPKDKQSAWHDQLNREAKHSLQRLLESFEKQNPGYAALLDDRPDWEIPD